jgi:hypothetical protein
LITKHKFYLTELIFTTIYIFIYHVFAPLSRGLIDYLLLYVLLKNFSLIWRRHHCRWRAAKFRPILAQGLWAGRDLYRATPTVTRDLCFSGLPNQSLALTTRMEMQRTYSDPDPHGNYPVDITHRIIFIVNHIYMW